VNITGYKYNAPSVLYQILKYRVEDDHDYFGT